MRYNELCEHVTAKIVDSIESGKAGTWRAPWHHTGTPGLFSPVNAATSRTYAGGNIVILAVESLAEDYSDHTWATYKQWRQLGAQVQRGEHGTRCIKWIAKTDDADDHEPDTPKRTRLIPRVFTVFNVAQVDGYQPPATDPRDTPDPIEAAEAFITSTGAPIDYGWNGAKYRPLIDRIQVPGIDQYRNAEDHYATVLHELVHWTGHRTRLHREFGERFGDDAYAAEELVAELGAAFATARLGISNTPRPDHAAYLSHWLRILKADPKALFLTAAKAQAAVDFLASYSEPGTAEEVAA